MAAANLTSLRVRPTAEQVRQVLSYAPETGEFLWKGGRQGVTAGKRAGAVKDDGRRDIMVRWHRTKTARVAWLLMTGEWPNGEIDHINGDPADDRFVNLRDVPHGVNMENRVRAQRDNRTGRQGVGTHRSGKYQARISVSGKNLYLGTFDSPEAAHAAYIEAKRRLHAGCTI